MRLSLDDPPFKGRSGAGVLVAVIDSGVHASHPHVGAIAEAVCIDPPDGDGVDRLGHGTAVASAIRDLAPGATLIVGKIFDRTLTTNAEALARAIKRATERSARVINHSLGTANRAHEAALRASVERATAAGVLIVSAGESNGVEWLPGALPGVVSVTADARLERNELIVGDRGLSAAPYPRSIPGVPREKNLSGLSFAVANATGFVARLLEHREVRDVASLGRALAPKGGE